ncbi:MAG: HypC/HybG/HupF family hydrogenase formation chaperone [Anaerolineaceae bacterium]|jgi:hydrogenase expression/formation protein HypC
MCLGIPGQVIEIYELDGTMMSRVDFGGVQQEVCIATVPEVQLGQYVIVHAGFALNVLSDEEAEETIKLLNEVEAFNQQESASQDE